MEAFKTVASEGSVRPEAPIIKGISSVINPDTPMRTMVYRVSSTIMRELL
jgi:hypothetical protein